MAGIHISKAMKVRVNSCVIQWLKIQPHRYILMSTKLEGPIFLLFKYADGFFSPSFIFIFLMWVSAIEVQHQQ